jgi:hypothetical protein
MPVLSPEYILKFKNLVVKIGNSQPINRKTLIENEIHQLEINTIGSCEDIELLKYAVSLNVLKDLSQQGWTFESVGDELKLKMEDEDLDDNRQLTPMPSAAAFAMLSARSSKIL